MNKTMRNAFWISKQGILIEVKSRHILTCIEYSKSEDAEDRAIFGWSYDDIVKIYKKNHEYKWFGCEGESRQAILLDAMKKQKLCRLRFHPRPGSTWEIQVHSRITKQLADNILNAFLLPLQQGLVSDFTCKSIAPAILIHNVKSDILLESANPNGAIKYLEEVYKCQ